MRSRLRGFLTAPESGLQKGLQSHIPRAVAGQAAGTTLMVDLISSRAGVPLTIPRGHGGSASVPCAGAPPNAEPTYTHCST